MLEILGYFASVFIGITLGLIGAGGGILSVPILVYMFGIKPEYATGYSLFIVGITAGVGAVKYYKAGYLKVKIALSFVIPSIILLLIVRKFVLAAIPEIIVINKHFTLQKDIMIMLFFALIMIIASLSMIRDTKIEGVNETNSKIKLAVLGACVGIVTGFLGAGGGFIIIPALVIFGGLEMKSAVGTSLLIICINTLIGFTGDILGNIAFDYSLLGMITGLALIGMFIGTWLSSKISGKTLKPVFGWFILLMGVYIVLNEVLLK